MPHSVPDTLIGVLGRPQTAPVDAILVALAVVWSGVAYVPIDVENNPPARQLAMLADARVKFCVGDGAAIASLRMAAISEGHLLYYLRILIS
jgi:hypothetical protein